MKGERGELNSPRIFFIMDAILEFALKQFSKRFPYLPTKEIQATRKGRTYYIPLENLLGIWKRYDSGYGSISLCRAIRCYDSERKSYIFPFSEFKNKSRISHFAFLFNEQQDISSLVFELREIAKGENQKDRLTNLVMRFAKTQYTKKKREARKGMREAIAQLNSEVTEISSEYNIPRNEILFSQLPMYLYR